MKWRYSKEEMERYFNDPEYRKRARRKRRAQGKNRQVLKLSMIAGLVVLLVGYSIYVIKGLPSLEELENPKPDLATRVLSADGQVIDRFYLKNRALVNIDKLPHYIVNALVSTEDK